MESVKRKNVALRTLIEAVEIPQLESSTERKNSNGKSFEHNLDLRMHDAIDPQETESEELPPLEAPHSKEYKRKFTDRRKESKQTPCPNLKNIPKLPRFRFPSSSRTSPTQPNSDGLVRLLPKRSSGLVPDLLQPDMMALKI
jgi:hypothetical protein